MRKAWTKNEINILKENYTKLGEEITKLLHHRSWHSIKIKAHKLGLTSGGYKLNQEQTAELIGYYLAGMSLDDLLLKYDISQQTLYRLLKTNNVRTHRKLVDFGSVAEFKKDYTTKSNIELENIYGTKFANIKAKASRLGIKRPKQLIDWGYVPEFTYEAVHKLYIVDNLSEYQTAEKLFGSEKFRSKVRKLVNHYGIKKTSEQILTQRINTKLEKYGNSFGSNGYGESQACVDVLTWINSFGFNFQEDWSILNPKQLDGYDPTLRSAIEYCGLYWHNEKRTKGRTYHHNKYTECKKQDIRLFTIFEDEWLHRQKQVKNFLKATLNQNSRRIFARKCKAESIDKKEAREFFDENHIQGRVNHIQLAAGLFYNDELLGAMSFGPHHRGGSDLVLNRLAFKEDVSVVGGSSKLFKYLLKETEASRVLSWSDNRWSEGSVYEAMGFVLDNEFGPDYSYVDENNPTYRLSKQSQKKSAVDCPAGITERDFAASKGLYRIWDCGKKRWLYQR